MTTEQIILLVCSIVTDKVVHAHRGHGDPPIVAPCQELITDLGLDDLDIVECVMEIEERIGVSLDDDAPCSTVRDLAAIATDAVRQAELARLRVISSTAAGTTPFRRSDNDD